MPTSARGVSDERAQAALRAVLEFYHGHLDTTIAEHADACDHDGCDDDTCSRPTTARKYFREVRGWTAETMEANLLGWAPPDYKDQLVATLYDRGFSREEMLATGLLGESEGWLYTLWNARYVLPYFDPTGEPIYAIGRTTGSKGGGGAGYDGHAATDSPGSTRKSTIRATTSPSRSQSGGCTRFEKASRW